MRPRAFCGWRSRFLARWRLAVPSSASGTPTHSGLLIFGTIGFACVGTLFAAMLARARSRDVLLPILLYPVTIPVMIAAVRGTGALLDATPQLDMARLWIMLLLSFDVVFLTLSLWTFEPVMTE